MKPALDSTSSTLLVGREAKMNKVTKVTGGGVPARGRRGLSDKSFGNEKERGCEPLGLVGHAKSYVARGGLMSA